MNGLLVAADDIDGILRQLAAEKSGDGGDFGSEVLQERAQKLGPEGFGGKLKVFVFLRCERGEEGDFVVGGSVRIGSGGEGLVLP